MTPPVQLGAFPRERAGELLTLQRATYVTEAQLYDDVRLPALTQTLSELLAGLAGSSCLAAWHGPRLVGAVRTREVGDTVRIGRLVVVPDLQGHGIGTRLLAAAEAASCGTTAALFTGHRSEANLRLYRRRGYVETHRERLSSSVELVHLTKQLVR